MEENRRPVGTRKVPFFQRLAKSLVVAGLTPNQISVASVIFAAVGAWGFYQLPQSEGVAFYGSVLLALLGIQLRLICNLIDGLMAVEGGMKTPTGELFNDIPDRFSDLFLIVAAANCIPFSWGLSLGWLTAVLAILTAYIRVLGASLKQGHDFGGPMAKQHRMFALNLILVAAVIEKISTEHLTYSFAVGISVIALGSLITVFARLRRLSVKLNKVL
jgi:phosphatidylglycerophosphate synthase